MLHSFCRGMKREHQPERKVLGIVLPTNFSISTEAAFQVLSACTMKNEFSIATINWFFWNLGSIHLASYTPILSGITAASYDKNIERITNAPTTAQHILCSSWWITPNSHTITSKVVALPLTMCTISWWGFQSSWTLMTRQSKVLDILFFTKSGNKICARGRKIRSWRITEWDTESKTRKVQRSCQRTVVLPIRNLILPERYGKKLKCTSINRYEDSKPVT